MVDLGGRAWFLFGGVRGFMFGEYTWFSWANMSNEIQPAIACVDLFGIHTTYSGGACVEKLGGHA